MVNMVFFFFYLSLFSAGIVLCYAGVLTGVLSPTSHQNTKSQQYGKMMEVILVDPDM
jgi:hypothetical protein